jgi:hypothetical protein
LTLQNLRVVQNKRKLQALYQNYNRSVATVAKDLLQDIAMNLQKSFHLFSAVLLCIGLVFKAEAQVAIRPEVAKSLQAAQDALKAGQLESALTLAQQTSAMPDITPVEKPIIQRTLACLLYTSDAADEMD